MAATAPGTSGWSPRIRAGGVEADITVDDASDSADLTARIQAAHHHKYDHYGEHITRGALSDARPARHLASPAGLTNPAPQQTTIRRQPDHPKEGTMPRQGNYLFELDPAVTRTPVSYRTRFGITIAADLYRPAHTDASQPPCLG